MADFDLTKLSDADLDALAKASGDVTKLSTDQLNSITKTLGLPTPIYNEGVPNAPNMINQPQTDMTVQGGPGDPRWWIGQAADTASGVGGAPRFGADLLNVGSQVAQQYGMPNPASIPGLGMPFGLAADFGSKLPNTQDIHDWFYRQSGQPEVKAPGPMGRALEQGTQAMMTGILGGPEAMLPAFLGGAGSELLGSEFAGTKAEPYVRAGTALAAGTGTAMAQRSARNLIAAPGAVPGSEDAARRALLQVGQQAGALPTAGRILNSPPLQMWESFMNKFPLPGVGGKIEKTTAENRAAFQNAVIRKAGGGSETAATTDLTRQLVEDAGAKVGSSLAGHKLPFDQQLATDISIIKKDFSDKLRSQLPDSVKQNLDDLEKTAQLANQPGTRFLYDAKTFQNVRSALSKSSVRSADPHTVGRMIDALDDWATRALPADAVVKYADARRVYRNAITLHNVMEGSGSAASAEGQIPVTQFKRAAAGNSDLEPLSNFGARYVPDLEANTSKTARHNMMGHLVTGLAGAAAGAGGVAGAHEMGMPLMDMLRYATALSIPYGLTAAMNTGPIRQSLIAAQNRALPSYLGGPGIGGPTFGALAPMPGALQPR